MLKNELEKEIGKWSKKLDKKLPKVEASGEKGKEILENSSAYRKDSEHFLEKGKLIQSYESLIWAWAFIEIGEKLELLQSE